LGVGIKMLLWISDLTAHYEHIEAPAIRDVSLGVETGEIIALLGPNGAGKSTVLRSIVRRVNVSKGQIFLSGQNIRKVSPHRLAMLGIAYVPEGQRVLESLTVRENLEIGAYRRRDKRAIDEDIERNVEIFPKLKPLMKRKAQTLSGGERQMLALGRGLMLTPKLLLLDEPSLGLAPNVVEEIFEVIRRIVSEMNIAVLLVEQNIHKALEVSDRAYLLEDGRIVMNGRSSELAKSRELQKVYLGG